MNGLTVIRKRPACGSAMILCLLALAASPSKTASVHSRDGRWVVENSKLRLIVQAATGFIAVRDKRAAHYWTQPGAVKHRPFTNVRKVKDGVSLATTFADTQSREFAARMTLTVPGEEPELRVTVDGDRDALIAGFDFIEPFTYLGTDGYLALADWCDGHIYPADIDAWPGYWLDSFLVNLLQMPWVGVFDLTSGVGYCVIVDTQDDAELRCRKFGARRAPLIHWLPQLGQFGYERKPCPPQKRCRTGLWVDAVGGTISSPESMMRRAPRAGISRCRVGSVSLAEAAGVTPARGRYWLRPVAPSPGPSGDLGRSD